MTLVDDVQKKKDQGLLGDGAVYFSHLSVRCRVGHRRAIPRDSPSLSVGAPLLARYDLVAAKRWSRDTLASREASMWRYREVMPLLDGPNGIEEPISLGEGWTPLVEAKRLGASLGLTRLFVKDESLNPTNSFKARGLSAAVTRAFISGPGRCRSRRRATPATRWPPRARAGLAAKVFMPAT